MVLAPEVLEAHHPVVNEMLNASIAAAFKFSVATALCKTCLTIGGECESCDELRMTAQRAKRDVLVVIDQTYKKLP